VRLWSGEVFVTGSQEDLIHPVRGATYLILVTWRNRRMRRRRGRYVEAAELLFWSVMMKRRAEGSGTAASW